MTMTDEKRPYAGQTWRTGMFDVDGGFWMMDILSLDLKNDVRNVGASGPIELWQKPDELGGRKGFFVGDTSSLPGEGWTKLATL